MAIINDRLKLVFLDEPLVPVLKFRMQWAYLPGSRVVGSPGESYNSLVTRCVLTEDIRSEYKFFTVVCNPAIALLRWHNMFYRDKSLDEALLQWSGSRTFVQAHHCEYVLFRESFDHHYARLANLLGLLDPEPDDPWPEDADWWEHYTSKQLHWMILNVREVERYHFDDMLRSIMRRRLV